jgi:hypothetical protein
MPRNKLVGLSETDVPGAPKLKDYRVDVADGIGQIVQR